MLAVQGEPCWEPDMATKHTASFVSSHVPRRPVERAIVRVRLHPCRATPCVALRTQRLSSRSQTATDAVTVSIVVKFSPLKSEAGWLICGFLCGGLHVCVDSHIFTRVYQQSTRRGTRWPLVPGFGVLGSIRGHDRGEKAWPSLILYYCKLWSSPSMIRRPYF